MILKLLDQLELGKSLKAELVKIAPVDQWRIKYLSKLLEQRQQFHYSGKKCEEEIVSLLIDSLCVN